VRVEPHHIGPALRLLRQVRNLRQYQLAKRAGVTKAMVSAYERGRRLPSLRTLLLLLTALGADFGTLQRALDQVERSTG